MGKLKLVIDGLYPLVQIDEAHTYVKTEGKKGNVVGAVEHNERSKQVLQLTRENHTGQAAGSCIFIDSCFWITKGFGWSDAFRMTPAANEIGP